MTTATDISTSGGLISTAFIENIRQAQADPVIANAANTAARRKVMVALPKMNPTLRRDYTAALRDADSHSHFLRSNGRYPLTGQGDVDTYQVFAELARGLSGNRG